LRVLSSLLALAVLIGACGLGGTAERALSTMANAEQSRIVLDQVPPYGSTEAVVTGHVVGYDPAAYKVAVLIYVADGWWTKPSWSTPYATIRTDRLFEADIASAGIDERATRIVVLLVPAALPPILARGEPVLPAGLERAAVARIDVTREPPAGTGPRADLRWSGLDWEVKTSRWPVGPGPCIFDRANVQVDAQDRLHLRIAPDAAGRWTCGEIVGDRSLGYGVYSWIVEGMRLPPPGLILGLFTWSDVPDPNYPDPNHTEIDVEIGRWPGDNRTSQFVLQPWQRNLHRFDLDVGQPWLHTFEWLPGAVTFETREPASGRVVERWTYAGPDVATPGTEAVRLNLWTLDNEPPADGQPLDVVVTSFRHTPAGP
jgi:hypothetical protein